MLVVDAFNNKLYKTSISVGLFAVHLLSALFTAVNLLSTLSWNLDFNYIWQWKFLLAFLIANYFHKGISSLNSWKYALLYNLY